MTSLIEAQSASKHNQELTIHQVAINYARSKIPTFPIAHGTKFPPKGFKGGFHNATTDLGQIDSWFRNRKINIAMPTGKKSGRIVIDDDCYKPGGSRIDGLQNELGVLPATYTTKTRAGGYQYHYSYPDNYSIGCSNGGLTSNVDIKGDGGYVLMAPSYVKKDEKGPAGNYEVLIEMPPAELPEAWAKRLEQVTAKKIPQPIVVRKHSNQFSAALGFVLEDTVPEGTRDSTMLAYAGSLRGQNIPEPVILQSLLDANNARCRPPLPEETIISIVSRYKESDAAEMNCAIDWPEPKPIEAGLPEVDTFDTRLLPKSFADYVDDATELMQCPSDYIAIPLMVAAAVTIGNKIAIAPKELDTSWLVSPTLWGGVVGRPGSLKSPAINIAMRPIKSVEAELNKKHEQSLKTYEFERLQYAANKGQFEKALKSGKDVTIDDMPQEPQKPERERIVLNDSTAPKVAMILENSPLGVLIFRDELTGWMYPLSEEGRDADRSFFLEGWNGISPFTVDRVGRDDVTIPHLNICIFGGIQPARLIPYVRSAALGTKSDDGLLQRFQLIVWPDDNKRWENIDRRPNLKAEQQAVDIFLNLRKLDPISMGANINSLSDGPAWLHYTSEAQDVFNKWRGKLERSLRSVDRHPILESHLAKYRSLIPTLSLIIHLCEGGSGPVTKSSLIKALGWHKYLYSHAKRVYASVADQAGIAAKALSEKIQNGKVKTLFTVRDIYRKGWSNLSTVDDVKEAIDILLENNWLRERTIETGGKRKTAYLINTRLLT